MKALPGLNGAAMSVDFRAKNSLGGPGAQVSYDLTFKIGNIERDTYDVTMFGLPQDFYLKSVRAGPQDMTETGSVQNAKDEPAPGVLVTLIPDVSNRSILWLFKTANTDQNGHFNYSRRTSGRIQDLCLGSGGIGSLSRSRFSQTIRIEGRGRQHQRALTRKRAIEANSGSMIATSRLPPSSGPSRKQD